jgi:spermidine/putrescine transport system substrate-binding protein
MKTRIFIATALIVALLCTLMIATMGCGGKPGLYFYNWGEFIDPELIAEFEKETGIRVRQGIYGSNEEMYVTLSTGASSYDIAIPSDYMIERMRLEGMLQKIDYSLIPSAEYIDDKFKGHPFDPTDEYSIPYMWGTVGIMYNTTKVHEPIDSWDVLWDERYRNEIFMYDSIRDTIGITLKRAGYSLNTTNPEELAVARQMLIDQRPLVRAYLEDLMKDRMINGIGTFGVIYSGDAVYCMGENPDLSFVVPKEGSNWFIDSFVILADAVNVENAHKFIEFFTRPEIMARNAEYIGYSTVSTHALMLMDEEFQNCPVYWPDDSIIARCELYKHIDLSAHERIWTDIRAE